MNIMGLSKYIYLGYWMKTIESHEVITLERKCIHTITHIHQPFTNIPSVCSLIIVAGISQHRMFPSITPGIWTS